MIMNSYTKIVVDLSPAPWPWLVMAGLGVLLAVLAGVVLDLARDLGSGREIRRRRGLVAGVAAAGVALAGFSVFSTVDQWDPNARDKHQTVMEAVERTWDVEVLLPATLPSTSVTSEYRVPVNLADGQKPTMCTLATYDAGEEDKVEVSLWCGGDPAPLK